MQFVMTCRCCHNMFDEMTPVIPLILLGMTILPLAAENAHICPRRCTCDHHSVTCSGVIPRDLPSRTIIVRLQDVNVSDLQYKPFTNRSWKTVASLAMILKEKNSKFLINPETFLGLEYLTNLTIIGERTSRCDGNPYYNNFTHAFENLQNLKSLRLLKIKGLSLYGVQSALRHETVMPNLKEIILEGLNSADCKKFDSNTVLSILAAAGKRSVTNIGIIDTIFELDTRFFVNVCPGLKSISFAYSEITDTYQSQSSDYSCSTLETIDLTNTNFPLLVQLFQLDDVRDLIPLLNSEYNILIAAKNVSFSGILTYKNNILRVQGSNEYYDMSGLDFKVQFLDFSNNSLSMFNVSLHNLSVMKDSEFDLSQNEMTYLHPKALMPGTNVRKLNLARNKLGVMSRFHPSDFKELLTQYTDLEEIDLSYNGISNLPVSFFGRNSKLTLILLAGNNIIKIPDLSHLLNLFLIDLSRNKIEILTSDERTMLNKLATVNRNRTQSAGFEINLTLNSFTCTCGESEDLTFMHWVDQSDYVVGSPTCEYDGKMYDMKKGAIKLVTAVCKAKKTLFIALVTCFAVGIIFVTVGIVGCLVRRRIATGRKLDQILFEIKSGIYKHEYLAFLSYANEDADWVEGSLFPELDGCLSSLTGCSRTLVCTGDQDFQPGFPILNQVRLLIQKSAVAVFVVSLVFCQKNFCQLEFSEAVRLRKPIILIFTENIDPQKMSDELRDTFQVNTRAKIVRWSDNAVMVEPGIPMLAESILDHVIDNNNT